MSNVRRWIAAACLALGCDASTIDLGQPCTDNGQCKTPANTCMLVAGKQRCTMACSKDNKCPEGYVCPVTDPANRASGMCLPAGEIGPNVVKAY